MDLKTPGHEAIPRREGEASAKNRDPGSPLNLRLNRTPEQEEGFLQAPLGVTDPVRFSFSSAPPGTLAQTQTARRRAHDPGGSP